MLAIGQVLSRSQSGPNRHAICPQQGVVSARVSSREDRKHLDRQAERVAIQQAAGIARSWRSNHQRAQEDFADTLADWLEWTRSIPQRRSHPRGPPGRHPPSSRP